VAVTVERISRDEALDIYTKAALKLYCREFNSDCVQRGENQIEKEISLVTIQYPPSAKTCRRKITYRNGARQGVNVDIAMKASGHTSVQMHKRYLDLQREDIAKAFGLLQDGNKESEVESQVV